jgi:protein ImuB
MYACLVIADAPVAPAASPPPANDPGEALVSTAREFSPRVERVSARAVVCDVDGLERLFGDVRAIASELRREAADRGVIARVAVAATRGAALLLAHARPGLTIVDPGTEAAMLAPLAIRALDAVSGVEVPPADASPPAPPARFYRTSPMQDIARAQGRRRSHGTASAVEARARYASMMETFVRWGVRTLGDLAALPPAQLSARLGQPGVRLQRLARGEDTGPLVPLVPEESFEAHLDLEWPIEGLEPLSFVLGRLLDPVCAQLERRGRAAAVLTTSLRLVSRETHVRSLQLPAAMRDARVLRTLALLDLEFHPPGAGIDGVTVRVEPTPGRVLQFSLLERALPAPEQLSTLVARLSALMGQDRCGSARTVDTHRPGAFAMVPFAVEQTAAVAAPDALLESVTSRDGGAGASVAVAPALRRFRHPLPIRVQLAGARPARVAADRTGIPTGHVEMAAGPWRSSGDWWAIETGREGRFGADRLRDTPTADAASRDTNARDSRAGGPVVHLAHPSARPQAWNRDEWDVALDDGTLCRIYRDRDGRGWFMEGCWD